jgi:hypothetical protein
MHWKQIFLFGELYSKNIFQRMLKSNFWSRISKKTIKIYSTCIQHTFCFVLSTDPLAKNSLHRVDRPCHLSSSILRNICENSLKNSLPGTFLLASLQPYIYHSRPQSHFHSVTRWKLGSGLHDQMERSDWLLREPANYHAH